MPTRVTRTGRTVAVPIDTGLCYGSDMRVFKTHRGKCPKCGQADVPTYMLGGGAVYYDKHLKTPDREDTLDIWNTEKPGGFTSGPSSESSKSAESSECSTPLESSDDCPF